jgi:NTE family protein
MSQDKLSPQIFTDAVQPYIDFLNTKFKDKPLCVSDIRDSLGKQYVDLVQEGGGVHGVALAGYTYVLEKMGIRFMKMAGTSAGSINTLLLNAVYTKEEAEALGKKGTYYDTRSEKVLEYLANKPLTDMVDGHPMWRKLLLKTFTGSVGMGGVVKTVKDIKRRAIIFICAFVVLLLFASGLAFHRQETPLFEILKWGTVLSVVVLVIIVVLLVIRILYFRSLYNEAERFGINPGDDFENWIKNDILEPNGIKTVTDLKTKLNHEEATLNYHYEARGSSAESMNGNTFVADQQFNTILQKIKNPDVKIDDLFDHLSDFISEREGDFLQQSAPLFHLMRAFEERLKAEDKGVTKELVIVSSDITHEIKVEFPGMHKMYWGDDFDISPAKYVRASMSVPFFFKPFRVDFHQSQMRTIENEWLQYIKVKKRMEPCALLVDGGMLSNFPINVFYNPKIPVPRKPTFGIKLEYEDDTAPKDIKSVMGFSGKLISTMRFFYDRDFIMKHDMYQKTVRSIDTGKIHWLNFNLTDEEKIELFYRGALAATIFLSKHATTETEIEALIARGEKVTYSGKTFSIYHEGKTEFKTEDRLIENSMFEWQQYKQQRMLDRIVRKDKKAILKENASLEMKATEKEPGAVTILP